MRLVWPLAFVLGCSSAPEPRAGTLDPSNQAIPCERDPAGCPCEENAVRSCVGEVKRTEDVFLCASGEQRCTSGRFSPCTIPRAATLHTAPLSVGCVDGPTTVGIAEPICADGVARDCRVFEHWGDGITACFDGVQRCEAGVFLACETWDKPGL